MTTWHGTNVPRYARAAARDPEACPDCAPGIQCVACRFAGRPEPRPRKYLGRLAAETLSAPYRGPLPEPEQDE